MEVSPVLPRSVQVVSSELRWCAHCTEERVFEVPPCEDGHGEDCLDLACMECGHAIVVGVLVAAGEQRPAARAA